MDNGRSDLVTIWKQIKVKFDNNSATGAWSNLATEAQ